jgi:hypothetical protein
MKATFGREWEASSSVKSTTFFWWLPFVCDRMLRRPPAFSTRILEQCCADVDVVPVSCVPTPRETGYMVTWRCIIDILLIVTMQFTVLLAANKISSHNQSSVLSVR